MKEYIIDRVEGEFFVCEDLETKEMISIEINKIDDKAKEGDMIELHNGKYYVNKEKTVKRKQKIEEMMKNLRK